MLKVYFNFVDYSNELQIYIIEEKPDGTRYFAKPIKPFEMKKHEEGEIEDPTMRFTDHIASSFLDALKLEMERHGIKPDSDFKIQGKLDATEKHLDDMRRLVFKSAEEKKAMGLL